MLVELLALENLYKEFIALFFDAIAKTLGVLEELAEDSVGVAQSSAVNGVVLQVALHKRVQSLKQLEVQQELNICLVSSQIKVERSNQGHNKGLFVQLFLSLFQLLLVVLQQKVNPVEYRLRIESLIILGRNHF